MTLLLLLSRHRRGSRLHRWARKQTQQRKLLRENIKELDSDLKEWRQLCAQRQQLAKAASERGQSWEEQAAAQKLEIDKRGFARHQKCMDYIQKKNLQRGVSPWLRKRALGGLDQPPPETWQAYADAAGVPTSTAARAVISESLSFPLTAAHAARLAGITADPSTGCLSLLVLGAEFGAELSGLEKWAELTGDGHGLGEVRTLHILFCGPEVPAKLDGETRHFETATGCTLTCAFVRGAWHRRMADVLAPDSGLLPAEDDASDGDGGVANLGLAQLALCFNSGLAEHAAEWLPSLRDLFWRRRVPLACTSYHQAEAELDARTLAVRLRVPASQMECMPNPCASELPHLDQLFPGRVYTANAFLSVALPP